MTELVTGEAVVLDVRRAELASRSLSLGIDLFLQYVALFCWIFLANGTLVQVDEALSAAIALTGSVAIILGYPVAMETLTRGRTLGKMALGLRVVREDGGPIRFRHALMRGLLGIVEIWLTFGMVAFLTSLLSSSGRRLGDLAAGTLVVRERVPVQGAPMPAMPPELAGWAAGLDLSRLPDDVALAARQYLVRRSSLSPAARSSMGESLADLVVRHVSPPPPPDISPGTYLSAVLTERRRRELSRMRPPPAFDAGGRAAPHAGFPAPATPLSVPAPAPGSAAPPAPRPASGASGEQDAFMPPS